MDAKTNGDVVFVLEFFTKAESSPPTVVWSDDIRMTELFIKQHCFDPLSIKRYVLPASNVSNSRKIQPDNMLIIAHMKSNTSDTVHNVVTTDEIIDQIIRELSDDLIDTLMFGELVTRNDVSFIKEMVDLIEQIDYASICDWELIADNVVDKYYDEDYYFYGTSINEHPEIPPPADSSYVQDSLFEARTHNPILPCTIEAYAHYFVSTILEV